MTNTNVLSFYLDLEADNGGNIPVPAPDYHTLNSNMNITDGISSYWDLEEDNTTNIPSSKRLDHIDYSSRHDFDITWTEYNSYESRLESFVCWPSRYFTQTPESLAHCGLFYTGCADKVTCFCCDKTLRNWKPGKDPYMEHLKHSPNCSFLKSLNRNISVVDGMSSQSKVTERLTRITRKNATVRTVLEMGFSIEDVIAVTTQAEKCGKTLDVPELIEAILNLERTSLDSYGSNNLSRTNQCSVISNESAAVSMNVLHVPDSSICCNTVNTMSNSNRNLYSGSRKSCNTVTGERNTIPNSNPNLYSGNRTSCNTVAGERNTIPNSNPNLYFDNRISSNTVAGQSNDIACLSEAMEVLKCDSENQIDSEQPNKFPTEMLNSDQNEGLDNQTSRNADSVQNNDNLLLDKIKRENLKLKNERLCRKCRTEFAVVLCLPCGHIGSCVRCADTTCTCFVCNRQIIGTVRTFLA